MADALDSLRLMRTQERPEQVFVRGQGSWLWDSDGRAFLDFTQGLAVNCLGHSPSVLVQALARQARELVSAGPGLLNRPVLALAQRLCLATGSDQAYFLTSGAEA
ncbi:aminotransferase class III-fold pyridoxal phosphate-dependent enzyme, partial [Pseudomonas aeruginosa]